MKKMSKIIAVALSLLMTVSAFAACGGGGSTSSKTDSSKAEESSKTEESSKAEESSSTAETPKKELSGKIVYGAMWNETEPQAEAIKYAIELMKKDYPNLEIEAQWIGRSNGQTIGPAIQAGEQIDVFDNVAYSSDPTLFADISSLYEEEAYGQPGVKFGDSILNGCLVADKNTAVAAKLTGKYYGVPVNPHVVGFFYNKELFTKAGITATPTTWTDFLGCCDKLVAAGIVPITTDDAYMTLMYSYYVSRLLGQEGVLKLAADPKDPLWTDGSMLKVAQAMQTLADKGYYSKAMPTNKYPAGQQEFALGEAAMYLNASWFPGEVAETAGEDFQWGEFIFPTVEGGKESETVTGLGIIPMNVSAKSTNQEAAKEFLRYVASKEVQEKLSSLGFAPATVGSVWPKTIADQGPIAAAATDVIGFGANFGSDFINGAVNPELNKVLTGSQDAAAAMAAIADASKTFKPIEK